MFDFKKVATTTLAAAGFSFGVAIADGAVNTADASTMCGCLTIDTSRTFSEAFADAPAAAKSAGIRPGRQCYILDHGQKRVAYTAKYLGDGKFTRWTSASRAPKCVERNL